MALKVPKSAQRLALEVEGWLELKNPKRALTKLEPLLQIPGARPAALYFRARALVECHRYEDALVTIDQLRPFDQDPDWLDLTEAWCLKRVGRLDDAVRCMRRLLTRSSRSAIGHYNLGCYLALQGITDEAIDEVSLACGLQRKFREYAASEKDLDSVRDDPRFQELLAPPA